MFRENWAACSAIAGFISVGLGCLILLWTQHFAYGPPKANAPVVRSESAKPVTVRKAAPAGQGGAQAQPTASQPSSVSADDSYYNELRPKVRWMVARLGNTFMPAPDHQTRMLLAKSAAQRAGLAEVGLSFHDVYGIINAETSWVPRTGSSKDGTPNLGIAQFEPATARLLGLKNPNDLVEAVHVAAKHMKEAALWSASRIAALNLADGERAVRLREGVSIYYNLSSRGRAMWNGKNTHVLPSETRKHIQNARVGAIEASVLEAQLQAAGYSRGAGVVTADASTQSAR
jgi:hypothetical protein